MASATPGRDWQLGCMELKQRGAHLLQSSQWSDCSFLVGSDSNRITIKAHKLVLACASPVFEAMFYGGMAEKDGPVEILDVEPEAFETLLRYIYTDKAEISSFERACSVYYSAKKYMLPYLEKECTWYISLNLNPKNVCRAYELAQLFEEKLLMDKCVKILTNSTKEVINEDSFEEADIGTLLTLLSQDTLSIDNELDLFHAIEKYANIHTSRKRSLDISDSLKKCHTKKPRQSLDALGEALVNMFEVTKEFQEHNMEVNNNRTPTKTLDHQAGPVEAPFSKDNQNSACDSNNNDASLSCSLDSENSDTVRWDLRPAVCKIRFLTLTAAQFAGGPARSVLLSQAESFAVLMNILSSQAPVPMPQGFSTSRTIRSQQLVPQEPEAESASEVVFRFTVLNFKTRRRSVESRPFSYLDMQWSIKIVPRFETDTYGLEFKYFGLYLKCAGRSGSAWSAKVRARVTLVSHDRARACVIRATCIMLAHVLA
ncbi:unnamed protein product [Chilo suppressalis]|uniref:BTB domain-containing protein n=1 Tax=Chilo suppressalis TaxID=168631 RepID=A0ABN8LA94_CHISP|nr:unnamed protein product [Chilo suppressalis]